MPSQNGRFYVIRASAGSGKTYRLVRDYLAACLKTADPHAFRTILAITFTNKAALEMRMRILEEIERVAEGRGTMGAELAVECGIAPEEVEQRAGAVRVAMLHRYEDMAVMTIDSFINRLVRSFTRELSLDQEFVIELDEQRLISEAVGRLLDRAGMPGQEDLTGLLEGFAKMQAEEEKDIRLRPQLEKFGRLVWREHLQETLAGFEGSDWGPARFAEVRDRLRAEVNAVDRDLRRQGKSVVDLIRRHGLEDGYFSANPNVVKWFSGLAKSGFRVATPSPTLIGMFEEGRLWAKSAKPDTVAAIQAVLPELLGLWEAYSAVCGGEGGAELRLKDVLVRKISLIGVLALLRDELDRLCDERNVRTLPALNAQISSIVRENPAPFIFERIGTRYQHIFIDEFQDTSITQWHNLVQLVAHVLSVGGSGLVVGDAKQAIYRWRNGDYRQLMALPRLCGTLTGPLQEAEGGLVREHAPDTLDVNYRSGRAVVEFNNRLFAAVSDVLPESLRALYADGAASQTPHHAFDGTVHVVRAVGKSGSDRDEARAAWAIERIQHHLASGFNPGDIAVLVRKNKDSATLAQALLAAGFTPRTEESLHLGRHPAALGAVALLRSILAPRDPRHAVVFLQCACALRPDLDEMALLTAHTHPDGEHDGVRLEALLKDVAPDLALRERSTEPVVGLIGHIFEACGWNPDHAAYCEGMLDLALEAARMRDPGIAGFLNVWDRKGSERSIRVSAGADAVRILTVHKAKGLAFPVVLAPFDSSSLSSFKDEIPVPLDAAKFGVPAALLRDGDLKESPVESYRQEELDRVVLDAVNLAYVAMTRAEERLDVLLEFPPEGKENKEPALTLPRLLAAALERAFGKWEVLEQGEGGRKRAGSEVEEMAALSPALRTGAAVRMRVAPPRAAWDGTWIAGWSPREFGDAVHGVLSRVRSSEDWGRLSSALASGLRMEPAQWQAVKAAVEAVVLTPVGAEFFASDAEVLCEHDLVDGQGAVVRPDRLVRRGNRWDVVDFKTGKETANHRAQVRKYMAAVQAAEPAAEVRGYLLYINDLKKVVVNLDGE
ncbi:MAG: UvrD-helicase domain-containing protein [Flavobacteriales bacterium]